MRTIDAVEQYHDRHIGEAGDTIRHEQADIRARAQRRAFHCHEAQAGWVDAGIRKLDGAKVGHGIVNTPLPLRPFSMLSNAVAASSRRSEEHTSELQSLMRISYAGFC